MKQRASQAPRMQYGYELPRSIKHSFAFDTRNENTKWKDALEIELSTLKKLKTFKILPRGTRAPPGYKCIPIIWIFAIKMDGRHRVRMCAGGHVTAPPTSITFSGVVEKETVRLGGWIESANGMNMWLGDVTNAFPRAVCREQVYFIAGPEFGDDEGCVVIIVMALYGLKTSGAAFHAYLADILRILGFKNCYADPDAWYRAASDSAHGMYYEYLMVYVDDILAISHHPKEIFDELQQHFEMKSVGPPDHYLGANLGTVNYNGEEFRYMASDQYLQDALTKLEHNLGYSLKNTKIKTPTVTDFHPELDSSTLLNQRDHTLYQSLIGTLQWLVTLGRIDIHYATSKLSQYGAAPRSNHLAQVIRVYTYLASNPQHKLVFDSRPRLWNKSWMTVDWQETYPNAKETIPLNMPTPRGSPVQINFWCDAAFATDGKNRRSQYGIIIFLGNSPYQWVCGQLKAMETSAFGAEYTTLRMACELVVALRYKLRMLGIPIDGPANGFVDNQAVVINSTVPESTLKKRYNFIAYHYVRELMAAGVVRLTHEPGRDNIADILTKGVDGTTHARLVPRILH